MSFALFDRLISLPCAWAPYAAIVTDDQLFNNRS